MVYSMYGILVVVFGNFEMELDFLEFESIVDFIVYVGELSLIGVIMFDIMC